jgi:hypothetical protein
LKGDSVVGTNQKKFYSNNQEIKVPKTGEGFYGQYPQFPNQEIPLSATLSTIKIKYAVNCLFTAY